MESLQGSPKALSLLIVEDDKAAVASLHLTIALKYSGCTVHVAENGQAGLELYQRHLPDIVITDVNMPGMNGIQMASRIKQLNPGAEIIAITAISDTHHLTDAIKIGISRYLLKPVEFEALFESIDACFARITMERRLKVQSEFIGKLSRVIEQSTDMVVITNQEGAIEYTNPKFSEVTGYSSAEVAGEDLRILMANAAPFESFEKLRDRMTRGAAWRGEITSRKKAGELFSIEASISPLEGPAGDGIQFVAVMQDISERKRAEAEHRLMQEQMLHVQKLESLGVLAGGIAHDFNNILMSIIGNADLALMRINRESPAVENLRQIEKASARAADLAKQMLAYSGKGKFVVEDLDLNVLLEEMLHMLQVSISKKAVLRLNLARNLPAVEVDATQLRQIVMNLVINASEAIGDQSGVIAITTGCMDCDKNYLKNVWLSENIGDGLYVYLEVADTGCGMTRETLARVFDPFFTTKFSGRGLGMAAVLGIVRGHKGAIKLQSEKGRGTRFTVLLPALSGGPEPRGAEVSAAGVWLGSGTVLLVDDEETIRSLGEEMLQAIGYQVLTACNGREALEVFRRNRDQIVCVLLDLTMPDLDGEQTFRELRLIHPELRVIMSSGYNEQEVTEKFAGKGLAGFIQKPYTVSEVGRKLREVLGAGC